jgi:transmembrane sensor
VCVPPGPEYFVYKSWRSLSRGLLWREPATTFNSNNMTGPEFTDLLHRFEKGLCTPQEKELLEKWIDAMDNGVRPFKNESDKIRVKNALRASVYQHAGLVQKPEGKQVYFLLKMAASLLLMAAVGYGAFTYYRASEAEKYAATEVRTGSEIEKVLLSDGSIVWLKPHSSLTYPRQFNNEGERLVSLAGEALFEVEKNPAQPFIVRSGELTTTVLGTSFNIRNTGERTEVFVLTGKVVVTVLSTNKKMELRPEEKAIYALAAQQLEKVEEAKKETEETKAAAVAAYTTGTEYSMSFRNTRMTEIARRMEGKFNVEVTLEGPVEACLITADFTDQSLGSTLEMITEALNASYTISNNKVTITGNGCN